MHDDFLTVAAISRRADVLPRGTTCEAVHQVFGERRDLNSVVVVTASGTLIVDRRSFFQAMTGRLGYGHTLHHRRAVEEVTSPPLLMLRADMAVETAAVAAAAYSGRTGEDLLVEYADGWGTVPVAALHRHLAEEFQSRAQQLERNQAQFRALVENAVDVIIVLDRDARALYHSRQTAGHPRTEVGDQAFTNILEDDAVEVAVAFQRLLAHPKQRVDGEFRVKNDAGGITLFEYNAANLLDDPAVNGVVVNYRDITARRALEEQLRRSALHDPLTGLANRTLLFERAGSALEQLERVAGHVSVLYCDLDGFKQINDSLGHHLGDRILIEAGERLSDAIRRGDTLARVGGDEFVVLADRCAPADAVAIADRVVDSFADPFVIDGTEVLLTVSVGFVSTEAPTSASVLVKQADMAMYASKLAGRNRSSEFCAVATDVALRARRLTGDLRLAAARGEMELLYQPIFAGEQGGMVGVEALLRWTHPTLGPISPLEFIPLAEAHGIINRIGRWVLHRACEAMAAWKAAGAGPDWVSVNVSALQLDESDLADHVALTLDAHGLEPSDLHLELTETAIAVAVPRRLKMLRDLRTLGLRIALDDFGTGYSSLSSLSHLPLDVIKIDRSFIAGVDGTPEAAVMLRGIIELAHSLGYEVVAEGVEREQELQLLEQIDCDQVQGYLLGRPVPASSIASDFRRAH